MGGNLVAKSSGPPIGSSKKGGTLVAKSSKCWPPIGSSKKQHGGGAQLTGPIGQIGHAGQLSRHVWTGGHSGGGITGGQVTGAGHSGQLHGSQWHGSQLHGSQWHGLPKKNRWLPFNGPNSSKNGGPNGGRLWLWLGQAEHKGHAGQSVRGGGHSMDVGVGHDGFTWHVGQLHAGHSHVGQLHAGQLHFLWKKNLLLGFGRVGLTTFWNKHWYIFQLLKAMPHSKIT